MEYLAIPYTDIDPEVMKARFEMANSITAKLMKQGRSIFSPISHSHNIDLGGDWKTWREFDMFFLKLCSSMIVVCAPGWKESKGVWAEINIFKDMGKGDKIEFYIP